jgi:hypothetical protein
MPRGSKAHLAERLVGLFLPSFIRHRPLQDRIIIRLTAAIGDPARALPAKGGHQRPSCIVSGTAVRDRDPMIGDFFQTSETDLTRSYSEWLGGTMTTKAVPCVSPFAV